MTALGIGPLPNVLSNQAAPNTLSGVTAMPSQAPRSGATRFTSRPSSRTVVLAGIGLVVAASLLITRVL